MIAAYYYIQYGTIEIFSSMLQSNMILKKILETLVNAEEFTAIPLRPREAPELRKLGNHLPLHLPNPNWNEARTKVHLLLQTHFERLPLAPDVAGNVYGLHDWTCSETELMFRYENISKFRPQSCSVCARNKRHRSLVNPKSQLLPQRERSFESRYFCRLDSQRCQ